VEKKTRISPPVMTEAESVASAPPKQRSVVSGGARSPRAVGDINEKSYGGCLRNPAPVDRW